ncbi:hypothetical protein ABZ671_11755 [Micromonospora sp. NPDC006766]|uniref:hypothetical protein n=1 Tax=Micromonospora sp. NPDC006766 TaxID=3154778 RepID=UPI0033F305A0
MDDLDDIAGGDARRAAALSDALDRLGRSDNPLLREMASAVKDGELTLREAVSSDAYSAELRPPFRTFSFWKAYQELTPQERDDLAARF